MTDTIDVVDGRLNDMEPALADAHRLYAQAQLEDWQCEQDLLWPDSVIDVDGAKRLTYKEGEELRQVDLYPVADKELIIDASAPNLQFVRVEGTTEGAISVMLFDEATYLWHLKTFAPPKVYQTQMGGTPLWKVIRGGF